MPVISRREALVRTATGIGAAGWLAALAPELGANPLQLDRLSDVPGESDDREKLPGTLKVLADAGFKRVELCSPVGYTKAGFGDIAKYKGSELKKTLGDHGLKCVSSHFSMRELRENQADRIAWAKDVGMTQMMVASLGGPKQPTMDDVKRAADEYNKFGENAAKAGIQQGLHNEGFEMTSVDGKRTTSCSNCSTRSSSNFNFRFRPSVMASMQLNISTSIRGVSFPCTSKGGLHLKRRSCPWGKAIWTGRKYLPRRKWAESRTTSWK